MASCCPPGRGCNAPGRNEACALTLCRAVADEEADAALALSRWDELQRGAEQQPRAERRFRRRAFERARDRALRALAMRVKPSTLARKLTTRAGGARVRQPPRRQRFGVKARHGEKRGISAR
jgi:hypothetical protein